jgi:DNA modification methylase
VRNPVFEVLLGDALEMLRTLPSNYFHCVVTSPPYWALRDYEADGMIGLEQSWDEFLGKLLAVFDEVRRVLRTDGVCWVNMGDAYAQKGKSAAKQAGPDCAERVNRLGYQTKAFGRHKGWCKATGTKHGINLDEKQLMMQPARLALGLQESGWYIRSEITWRKPNACPSGIHDRPHVDSEKIYMVTKTKDYWYDRFGWMRDGHKLARSTWDIPSSKRGGVDHYATFPIELPRRCIKLATSAMGCCEACGAPQVRNLVPTPEYQAYLGKSWHDHKDDRKKGNRGTNCRKFDGETYYTDGWKASCECVAGIVPCRVLDPFSGSGTTGLAALELGRDYCGVELNPNYHANSVQELAEAARRPVQLDLLGGAS